MSKGKRYVYKLTSKLYRYTIKFICRALVFSGVLFMYVYDRNRLTQMLNTPFREAFFKVNVEGIPFASALTPLHLLWALFMCIMMMHLIPNYAKTRTMAWLKMSKENYVPTSEDYDELELLKFVQYQNRKAWEVMLVWLCFNAIWGFLYLFDVIQESELLLITAFYFLSDYICILFYCPFQTHIMKNKCCVNCRIYDWGHFMMFTPMLFIRNFFSWSLFFTSIVVLIRWEIYYTKYPERFYEGTNKNLQCEHCKDKTCRYKSAVKHFVGKESLK